MKLGIDVETLKKSNIKAVKRSERMRKIILFLTAQKSEEQQRNNKETTKREQRKDIDGSNHEFENFENIYIVKRN